MTEHILNSEFVKELEVWLLSEFPITVLPEELIASINTARKLITIEEHMGECGLRETLSYHLLNHLTVPIRILSLCAQGYPSGLSGDQSFHQNENSLSGESLHKALSEFLGNNP